MQQDHNFSQDLLVKKSDCKTLLAKLVKCLPLC